MELSDGEKLILTMLCDLQSQLKIRGRVNHKLVSAAVISGNTWGIKQEYPEIFAAKTVKETVTTDVSNIMDMWAYIELTYQQLGPHQRDMIEREAHPYGTNVFFGGFDPDAEVEHWATCNFLVNHMGRYDVFRGRDLDNPTRSLEMQRHMYLMYRKLVTNGSLIGNTKVTYLIAILRAARSPVAASA